MRVFALILIVTAFASAEKWSWGSEGRDSPHQVVFADSKKRAVSQEIRVIIPVKFDSPETVTGRHSSVEKLTGRQSQAESITEHHGSADTFTGRQGPVAGYQGPAETFTGRQGPVAGYQGPAETVTGRQSRKIESGETKKGEGKTEGRLSGIRRRLCKVGLGINCPSGYDLLEVQPHEYQEYPAPYPAPYGGVPNLHGPGIDPQQVLAVQPVALQPVGSPIQAVPLGPGGHSIGGGYGSVGVGGGYGSVGVGGGYGSVGVGGGYGSVGVGGGYNSVPIGGAGYGVGVGGYGSAYSPSLPSASYGISASGPVYGTPYSPPSHKSQYSGVDFSSSFDPDYSDEEILPVPVKKEIHVEPAVVKHYHTHTHIHKGNDGSSLSGFPYSSGQTFTRPARSHTLPVIPQGSSSLNSLYREDCECVPNNFCAASEVVGRSSSLPLLDARNRPTDVLSTAPDNNEQFSASEKKETVVKAPNKKSKREIGTTFKVFNVTSQTQGRQVHGTPRIRNIRANQQCARGEVCCRNPGFTARTLSYTCGKKNRAGVLGRVRNAKVDKQLGDTEFGEYPWQSAILKRESSEVVYVCGAALVNDKHVITAAHCVNGMSPSELKIRLGEWDVNRKTEFYDYVESGVKKIIIHPNFYSGTLTNDIAILVLEDMIDFSKSPHINPVCLPHSHSDFMNRHCHVTGWGKDAFGNDGNFQFILKEVEVPVWGHQGCESALRKTRLGVDYQLHDGMLCAGGEEGKDACKGDGGGPLVCTGTDGSMELTGIVSWGIGCGESGIPGVYVNVPHYMEWITETLQTVR